MASGRPTLKVAERSEFGSRTTRRLRRDGLVPGIVYANGQEARPFQANGREIAAFLGEGHTLFDLEIEGAGAVPVVVKDEQRHPVRGELMHIDCHEVRLDVKIQADVALELEGVDDAPGVKEGGIMEHVTREITVEALPTDIPENITVDVSEMVIGDTVQLSAITAPEGTEFTADSPDEVTIATLNPPPVEEEPEPDVEEDPELVGEEGEEAPEGEEDGGEAESSGEGESSGDASEGDDGGE